MPSLNLSSLYKALPVTENLKLMFVEKLLCQTLFCTFSNLVRINVMEKLSSSLKMRIIMFHNLNKHQSNCLTVIQPKQMQYSTLIDEEFVFYLSCQEIFPRCYY